MWAMIRVIHIGGWPRSLFRLTFGLAVFLIAGCGGPREEVPLEPDRFAKLYADLIAEQAWHPEKFDSLRARVLETYAVSPALFDSTAAYYRDHPEAWQQVLERVIQVLDERLKGAIQRDSLRVVADSLKAIRSEPADQPR